MINKFISESGLNSTLIGNYNFSESRMWIPEENTISGIPTHVGEIRHILSSGLITIWDGTNWLSYAPSLEFTPNDISSLKAWYDLSQESFASGNTVSSITDRSASGIDLDNVVSTPNYHTPITAGTSNASVSYVGSERHVTTNNIGNIRTIAGVFKRNSSSAPTVGSNDYIFSIAPDASHRLVMYIEGAASNAGELAFVLEDNDSFSVVYATTAGVIDNQWHYFVARIEPTGNHVLKLDGTPDGSGTHALDLAFNDTMMVGNWMLAPGAPNAFDGQIAELIFYDDYISESDISLLESYLQAKYGL